MSRDAITRAFSRACKRAAVEGARVHDLRHEATSRLAGKLQLHELMKVIGHKYVRLLGRNYHLDASELAKKLG